MNGMEPPLKNTAIIEDITSINSMKKHADKNIDRDLFKIIRSTKNNLHFYHLNIFLKHKRQT